MQNLTNNEIEEKIENYLMRTQDINLFKVLGMQKGSENRHSNFIAWLLNPYETHGFKEIFLQRFLNIQKEDIKDFVIEREKFIENGRPDILISKNRKPYCIIEVKFGAKETRNQCEVYYHNYGETCKYILLDLNENCYNELIKKYNTTDFEFRKIYELKTFDKNVLPIVKDLHKQTNNKKIKEILHQYIILLEEKYEIYGNHQILDLILLYHKRTSGKTEVLDNLFEKYKYPINVNKFLGCRQYKIMEILYTLFNQEYKNKNSLTFDIKDIIITNTDTIESSQIKYCRKNDDKWNILFDVEEYNDKLFYIYGNNAENLIKLNLKNQIKNNNELKNLLPNPDLN